MSGRLAMGQTTNDIPVCRILGSELCVFELLLVFVVWGDGGIAVYVWLFEQTMIRANSPAEINK